MAIEAIGSSTGGIPPFQPRAQVGAGQATGTDNQAIQNSRRDDEANRQSQAVQSGPQDTAQTDTRAARETSQRPAAPAPQSRDDREAAQDDTAQQPPSAINYTPNGATGQQRTANQAGRLVSLSV